MHRLTESRYRRANKNALSLRDMGLTVCSYNTTSSYIQKVPELVVRSDYGSRFRQLLWLGCRQRLAKTGHSLKQLRGVPSFLPSKAASLKL